MKLKLRVIRITKRTFIYFKLHILFGIFKGFYKNFVHLNELSSWIAKHKNSFLSYELNLSGFNYDSRYQHYEKLLEYTEKYTAINYLEFGVCNGLSFKWWAEHNVNSASRFYGFDTFTGLPEDWNIFKAGDMSTGGKFPEIDDNRAFFLKGLFQETLPDFLKEIDLSKHKNVIHLDADLFTSTMYVLGMLHPYLKPGDILFFDEFAVPTHEFLAYKIYLESYRVELKPLHSFNGFIFVSFEFMGPARTPIH